MSDRRRRKFTPLGELLDGVLEEALPDDRGLRSRLAAEAFLKVAGPAVAGHCRVLGLDGNVLRVAVSTPHWHKELQRMGTAYLHRVNSELPPPFKLWAIRFLVCEDSTLPLS